MYSRYERNITANELYMTKSETDRSERDLSSNPNAPLLKLHFGLIDQLHSVRTSFNNAIAVCSDV